MPDPDAPALSVVVPAYNEQEVLPEFHRRLAAALADIGMAWEVVYVNDGSRDTTLAVMLGLQATDPRVAVVNLSRNFGKEIALTAGIDHARGSEAIIVIDADLQDPPELIPTLVGTWREGFDIVYAQRNTREGETWLKKATAAAFYRVMQRLGGKVQLPPDTGDFRLLSRRAIDALLTLREQHRFMKGLFAWIGFPSREVPYRRHPRFHGTTKWNYPKLIGLSVEGITSFSTFPLRLTSFLGLAIACFALLNAVYYFVRALIYGDPVQGFPTLYVTILLLGGVQLLALGVMGEYLGRVFNETKRRPLYFVESVAQAPVVQRAPAAPAVVIARHEGVR